MAKGAWAAAVYPAVIFRQAIAMDEDEEPVDPDPFGLFSDEGSASDVMPYDPAVLQAMQNSKKWS